MEDAGVQQRRACGWMEEQHPGKWPARPGGKRAGSCAGVGMKIDCRAAVGRMVVIPISLLLWNIPGIICLVVVTSV